MKNAEIIRRVNGESFIAVIQGVIMEAPDTLLFDKTSDFWVRYRNRKKAVACLKPNIEKAKAFLSVLEDGKYKVEEITWPIVHENRRVCYVKLSGNRRISIRLGGWDHYEWVIRSIHLSQGDGGSNHTVLKIES